MHQVKIFKGLESESTALEKQINAWLAAENVRVVNIFGNIAPQSPPPPEGVGGLGSGAWAPSDMVVFVHYEK